MTIALYFGSFNPFHNAHLHIARYIIDNNVAEELWFVISPQNPLKEVKELINPEHRLEMLKLITNQYPEFKLCDIEFYLPTPSYTVNTLKKLKELYPEKSFSLLIGSDSLEQFHLWRDYEYILKNYQIIVFPRKENFSIPELYRNYNLLKLNCNIINLSSTFIRTKIMNNQDISEYVPDCILKYMISNILTN